MRAAPRPGDRSGVSGGAALEGRSLYDPRFEHDACGIGFVARTAGGASHEAVRMALTALGRLEHRGAVAADGRSGDGAGILTRLPRRFMLGEAQRLGVALSAGERFAVGVLFLPADAAFAPGEGAPAESAAAAGARVLAEAVAAEGLHAAGWRDVPVDATAIGESARASMPRIRQLFVSGPAGIDEETLEARLHLARKRFERSGAGGYVCSLSCRTVVYKALSRGADLGAFYPDLRDPEYESDFAVFHQRYSTNTSPTWELAQPFRLLAHNGEINTLSANRAWLRARESELPPGVRPVFREDGSDSATLDEALELLTRRGRDIEHGLSMMIVPAWEEATDRLAPTVEAFHRYHGCLMEPWDGPAALAFSDGRVVGAALDRNGLRPCRYAITSDGWAVAGSEVGLFDLDESRVLEKGRLGPGQMLLVDLRAHKVLRGEEIRARLAGLYPFGEWLGTRLLEPLPRSPDARVDAAAVVEKQRVFGFTAEDLKFVVSPMVDDGREATWSMGDDTPIAPLARSPRPIYGFLRQRFAQVTNPPIDPLREASVMSLRTWLGPRPPLLGDGPQPTTLEVASPVLTLDQLAGLHAQEHLRRASVDCTFDPAVQSLPAVLDRLCEDAEAAARAGAQLIFLTDRAADLRRAPVPMALCVGAVHQRLLATGLRRAVGIIAEAGDCWDVHHVAVLLGYGAGAVCPWLALGTAAALEVDDGEARLVLALDLGLRKVLSKMGISTVTSYRSGQLFEVLGLADDVVARCFTGTPSRIGGLGWEDLQEQLRARHAAAVAADEQQARLADHGLIRFRRGDQSEHHSWQPLTVRALQGAVGALKGGAAADPAAWVDFRTQAAGDQDTSLRAMLDFVPAQEPVPVDEVEPAATIIRRFVLSAMSLGALSPEAHRTLTVAMNRLGARSNSGEGGEDPELYDVAGDRADSRIKQVASGRFGVTAQYLAHAEELEIKIAQGAKPGEGGQLPGHKVSELIARLRHSQVGRTLISPPPHHDIYSIEDLAQLIYDLKRCNPNAPVGVKLVAEAGIGTIAAGVVKASADYVVVSGHSGGTGASPLSSIKYAGSPWELGLAETHQVLQRNRLRDRARIRVDGGLMTANDVIMAALLGADEFGFGTAPLVALGCDMARQCHLNSCPTGIATQRPELRAKFRGTPEHVIRYFELLAEDVRQLLAGLGMRSLGEAVGRVDLLRQSRTVAGIDLAPLLAAQPPEPSDGAGRLAVRARPAAGAEPLDEGLLLEAARAIETGGQCRLQRTIRNADRAVGARIAGVVALRWGAAGMAADSLDLRFAGSAGQSFGAFCCHGMRLDLLGEANDYVGKGLCGADIVLRPVGAAAVEPSRHVILGNVALYGATSGRLFAAGRAGERFAVRNSGATAVVEGVGDHACEYMTGGVVVVLGSTGENFGAGMTGGLAFVYDDAGSLEQRLNTESVTWSRPDGDDVALIRSLVLDHAVKSGSPTALAVLRGGPDTLQRFWRIEPREGARPAVHEAVQARMAR